MDNRTEIREFLVSRRARITPQQAGLPVFGGHRRVPGLRREELALLAGVSVDYYVRLERGNLAGVSESVLAANRLGEALYAPRYAGPTRPVNHGRFVFLDPAARDFYPDWEGAADVTPRHVGGARRREHARDRVGRARHGRGVLRAAVIVESGRSAPVLAASAHFW